MQNKLLAKLEELTAWPSANGHELRGHGQYIGRHAGEQAQRQA